jgi:hypothetical protein
MQGQESDNRLLGNGNQPSGHAGNLQSGIVEINYMVEYTIYDTRYLHNQKIESFGQDADTDVGTVALGRGTLQSTFRDVGR